MHARRPGPGHGFGWFPRFVAAAAAALAVGVVAGCDSNGAIPIDEIPASVEATLCREAVTCGGGPDQAACEAAYFVSEDNSLKALVAAVKRGTIVYDGHRARECLDEYGRDCIQNLGAPPACDETFRGTVAEGGPCQVRQECLSGQCEQSCGNACCVGTCVAGPGKIMVGGDCTATGSVCLTGAHCKSGQCVVDLPIGAACAAGDVCRRPGQCTAGAGGSGACLAPPVEGAACAASSSACLRNDDYCDPVAQKCLKRKPAGAACAGDNGECAAFAPCVNGVCTPPPTLGQPCTANGPIGCYGELECTNGVCVAPSAPNQCPP